VFQGYGSGVLLGWAVGLLFCAKLAKVPITGWYLVAMLGFLAVTSLGLVAKADNYRKVEKSI
jgi:hypothetical protein